jgi:hypothetical protein
MAAAKQPVTRKTDYVPLIGHAIEEITGSRLPCVRDVLRNLFFSLRSKRLTFAESASNTYENVIQFWDKSRLPTMAKHHVVQKLRNLYDEHQKLMKNYKRSNSSDQKKQQDFTIKLDRLFDISHAESQKLIKNDEDWQFLQLQRSNRTGTISGVDFSLARREKKANDRDERARKYAEKQFEEQQHQFSMAIPEDDSSEDWPAQSPDMNITEHVWGRMKEEAWKMKPKNLNELWEACKTAFYAIPVDFINKLYESLPYRMDAVLQAHGSLTRY